MQIRFLVLLLLPVLAQAQMYRWVDDAGKMHFSDRPPLSGAKNVQKQALPAMQSSSAPFPFALQQAVRNYPVTLYISEICKETCARARELLDKRGVPYSEVNVKDEADLAQLKQLSGDSVVPVMTVGHEVYKGFESGIYKTALDNASYPSSSLLPTGVQARQPVTKPVPKAAATEAEAKPETTPQETTGTAAPK